MLRLLFVLFMFAASAVAIESNFYREEPCANATGYCVLESECPYSVSAPNRDLCPGQKKDGAVCCINFPRANVNCFQEHNACMDEKVCPPTLTRGRKGCPKGQTCCVLI